MRVTSYPASTRSAGELRIDAASETTELGPIRHSVRRFVEALGGDDSVLDDLELVVSELATNVLQHTASPKLSVIVRRTPDRWEITVADAEDIPPFDTLALPDTDRPAGRGLFVVQALMDDVALVEVDGAQVIRCSRAG